MVNIKSTAIAAALLSAGAMLPGTSVAATSFESLILADGTYVNEAQDISGEFILRAVQTEGGVIYVPVTEAFFSGDALQIQVGDYIGGAFKMDSLNTIDIGSGSTYTGMAGFYIQEVNSISGSNTVEIIPGVNITVADFDFKPVSDTSIWQAVFGVDVLGGYYSFGALSSNTMLIVTEDLDQSFSASDLGNVALTLTEAVGASGEFWASLGFDPTGDDAFWDATAAPLIPQEIIDLGASYAGAVVGSYGYGLDVLDNNTPFTFATRFPTVDYEVWTTAGNLYIPGAANAFTIEDDVKATFKVTRVPEPATLALLGAGLVGMGASLRRRKKV